MNAKPDKKAEKLEKKERKLREREEKARIKEDERALKQARRREKVEALEELHELPEVEGGEGEALSCSPGEAERVEAGGELQALGSSREQRELMMEEEYLAEALLEPGPDGSGVEAGTGMATEAEEGGSVAVEELKEAGLPPGEELPPQEERERWLTRLRRGLSKSRLNFVAPLAQAMAARRFDQDFWDEVEDILVGSDVGFEMTATLVERVRERMAEEKVKDPEVLLALFREVLAEALDVGERELRYSASGPSVFMVVGVNGTGKTTTIAKLAHLLRREGKRVLLAAGDTFRAAGVEQLETWGKRVGVHTVKHKQGADAAAVVHDAVESARARDMDVVIADTAGRLHTKANLMQELKKIKRVAERGGEVTETLLVIDATTGQNGLVQAQQFRDAVEVTGVVLTKLDGTAKGGIVVAIVHELGIPIKFIGVGENLDDLHGFEPSEYAAALFS